MSKRKRKNQVEIQKSVNGKGEIKGKSKGKDGLLTDKLVTAETCYKVRAEIRLQQVHPLISFSKDSLTIPRRVLGPLCKACPRC